MSLLTDILINVVSGALGGKAALLHLDASRPEALRARTLAEEIAEYNGS